MVGDPVTVRRVTCPSSVDKLLPDSKMGHSCFGCDWSRRHRSQEKYSERLNRDLMMEPETFATRRAFWQILSDKLLEGSGQHGLTYFLGCQSGSWGFEVKTSSGTVVDIYRPVFSWTGLLAAAHPTETNSSDLRPYVTFWRDCRSAEFLI